MALAPSALTSLLPTALCVIEHLLSHLNALSANLAQYKHPTVAGPVSLAAEAATAALLSVLTAPLARLLLRDMPLLESESGKSPTLASVAACIFAACSLSAQASLFVLSRAPEKITAKDRPAGHADLWRLGLCSALDTLETLTVHPCSVKSSASSASTLKPLIALSALIPPPPLNLSTWSLLVSASGYLPHFLPTSLFAHLKSVLPPGSAQQPDAKRAKGSKPPAPLTRLPNWPMLQGAASAPSWR
jgi:hypothetical protein